MNFHQVNQAKCGKVERSQSLQDLRVHGITVNFKF